MSDIMSAPRKTTTKKGKTTIARKPRARMSSEIAGEKHTVTTSTVTTEKVTENTVIRKSEPLQGITRRSENSFGIRLSLIRIMLGQTQESFADLMMTTRQAVASMEKCTSIDELKEGMIFRLYYLLSEVSENTYFASEIRQIASSLLNDVRTYIADRTN